DRPRQAANVMSVSDAVASAPSLVKARRRLGKANARPYTVSQRVTRVVLAVLATLVLAFLVAPIVIIVPLSFSSGSFFYYPIPGFSLRWYQDFFTSSFWLPSVKNSLIVGASATFLPTLPGTLAALGISRARSPAHALVLALLISPLVVRAIIV